MRYLQGRSEQRGQSGAAATGRTRHGRTLRADRLRQRGLWAGAGASARGANAQPRLLQANERRSWEVEGANLSLLRKLSEAACARIAASSKLACVLLGGTTCIEIALAPLARRLEGVAADVSTPPPREAAA